MILINRTIFILLFFLLLGCSLDKKSGIWTKSKKILAEKNIKTKELFKEDPALDKEINPNLRVNLTSKLLSNSFVGNKDNNNGRIKYDGDLKKKSSFRFSKIDNFDNFEPEVIFHDKDIIFFDNKGSIFRFDENTKLIWKKNYYSKREKKLKPILSLAANTNVLIVSDSITKFYAININNGDLIWTKNNDAPFNSQIKIFENKFYVVDNNNTLKCFSIKDGSLIFEFKTEKAFIRSQKKMSLILIDEYVYFNNSIGDITAVDINSGDLIWQTPTRSTLELGDPFFLKTSDIVGNKDNLFFSNNKNQFFSIDAKSGVLNWKQKINSDLRPTLINNFIFTITNEGYLVIIDIASGEIKRANYLLANYKKKKRDRIKPIGFVVGSKNIYLTTSNGRLMIVDILTGKVLSTLKIDNSKISRPFILNQNMFIVKENAIIKIR